ncbi:DUF6286 domain-containing protein [Kitasatospora sp. NPDC048540]|uniref:DUF6286 domain-containing protein n=1 Tax=Kitasatospora sp. NPDC048540 TaxID=3155634 RepID=UPI0033FA1660
MNAGPAGDGAAAGPAEPVEPVESPEPEAAQTVAGSGVAGGPEVEQDPKARGPRSPRTVPAFLTVLAVLVLAGGLLYDVIAVRSGFAAAPWRARVAHELAVRGPDDPWVLAGAGVAVVLGALLLWGAFSAGARRWLPLREPGAVIDRSGVAVLIAVRAAELPGVQGTRVRVVRRRTVVRVTGAVDPAAVQRALRAELAAIPLAAPNRLDVRVRAGRPAHPHRHGGLEEPAGPSRGAAS